MDIYLVDSRYGKIDVPDVEGDLIGKFINKYGEWAWDEAVFVASLLDQGSRLLDVGAYLGTFGLGVGIHQILANTCYVEANPQIFPYLRDNIRRLKRHPSQVVSALVVPTATRPMSGFMSEGNFGSLSFAENAQGQPFGEMPESTISLKELRDLYGPFDLIKLDVEGMERELIQSDADFFRSGACKLWLECNETPASLQLAELLLELGLEVYYFAFPSYNPNNLRNDPDPIFPFAHESGLLAGKELNPKLDSILEAHQCLLFRINSVEDLRAAMWRTPRWGKAEWEAKSAREVARLASREMLGQDFASFLSNDAPAPQWQDGSAIANQLHDLKAQLQRQQEALDKECQTSEQFYRQAEARGLEVAALQSELRSLTEQIAALNENIRHGQEAFDAQSAQLSQIRDVASERLFQLDIATARVKSAEESAARAQARMLQSTRVLGRERDELRAAQQTLQDALSALEAQNAALDQVNDDGTPVPDAQAPLNSESAANTLRRRIRNSSLYQRLLRTHVNRLRRLLRKGGRS
ncbi:FkbM family methyltransferase [Microvirga sp. 2YAF29]|uniref:FkbM family methyltransferase n=1 Tax=Microvirga sp. 2YAF29 TaxID=3233031 RepID=UPI003F9D0D5D